MNTLKHELQQWLARALALPRLVARIFWPTQRRIVKYNVAPRLGLRTVERRLRQRLPELVASMETRF